MGAVFEAELKAIRGFGDDGGVDADSLVGVSPLERLLPAAQPLDREDEALLARLLVRREGALLVAAVRRPEGAEAWRHWSEMAEATSKRTPPPGDPAAIQRVNDDDAASGLDHIDLDRVHRSGFLRHLQRTESVPDRLKDDFQRLDDVRHTLLFRNVRFARWATPIPWFSARESLLFGTLGLVAALDRFEPGRSRVTTYARHLVKARKTRASRRWTSALRDPGYQSEQRMKVRAITAEYRQEEREPSIDDLVEGVDGVDRRRVAELYRPRPLGERLAAEGGGGAARLLDLMTEDPLLDEQRQALLRGVWELVQERLNGLPERERHVASSRLGLEDQRRPTLAQLGSVLGLSRERVRQIEKAALESIRVHVLSSGHRPALGPDHGLTPPGGPY